MTSYSSSDVTIIIVTYNSSECIRGCLNSIEYSDVKIIIIDNKSTDNTRDLIQNEYPHVQFIENTVNLGFGNACNLGFSMLSTQFALLVNPDARLTSTTIQELLRAAERYP